LKNSESEAIKQDLNKGILAAKNILETANDCMATQGGNHRTALDTPRHHPADRPSQAHKLEQTHVSGRSGHSLPMAPHLSKRIKPNQKIISTQA
jgi:hypothetical protein